MSNDLKMMESLANVYEQVDSSLISDFIVGILENVEDSIDESTFNKLLLESDQKAVNHVDNRLKARGHFINRECLLEALETYKKDFL